MFQSVPQNVSFPKLEEEVLAFWKSSGIYEKSLAQRAGCEKFVFYEGPPTANGMPHPGHCLTRAIKDLFPRYQTMRGKLCERKAGWDTHGLPVEVEVCKEMGIHSKEEIEAFGVEPFIHKCQESVWRYMQEWERLTERLGFWIKLDEAYVTYHQSYVESVWWSLKNLFDRGLLYQGHKIVWWWAQGGTALSSGEVGQGYREVADPSVYVRFPLLDDDGKVTDTSLLVWTTTPWTLPSNQFAAVHPEVDYSTIIIETDDGPKRFVVATALAETIAAKVKTIPIIESTCKGQDLVGKRYLPPFDYFVSDPSRWGDVTDANLHHNHTERIAEFKARGPCQWLRAWRVEAAEFVTTDSGTGIVHIAPAFGEDDFGLLKRIQDSCVKSNEDYYIPTLLCPVDPNGRFQQSVSDFAGRWVKECDRDIIRDLKKRDLWLHDEQYVHDYPFCWRSEEDPLIQYPRKSWFIKTTAFKDQMLANNEQINWLPEHIKHGRFGNFLESNVDWALSRERFWGTPLPIWQCVNCQKAIDGKSIDLATRESISSYGELLAKPDVRGLEFWEEAKRNTPSLPDDLKVHKPYIDNVTYASPCCAGNRMRRVPEVIDCWYDSGAMPFAQWGYPHTGQERFADQFPADFISEAIDQTRGWFYSQLAISTLLFGKQQGVSEQHEYPHPFKNCIVLGLMLAEWWEDKHDSKRVFLTEAEAIAQCGEGNVVKRVGKMSKQKRNYRSPQEIFGMYGADALRWYFFANQPPWNSILYSERAIKDSIPEFLLRLWNVYSFFVIYANIDGFDPAERLAGEGGELTSGELAKAKGYRPVNERGELDRWVLSELNRTAAAVVDRMDAYDNYVACARLIEFVDALSNWYVRRSRDRFWSDDKESPEKLDAYWTLYECLLTTSKLIAPFTPFLAEGLWRNLAGVFGVRAAESVHLCDYPTGRSFVDDTLSEQMKLLREIASLGRAARGESKLKVRQPLAKVEVILAESSHQPWLEAHDALLREELNVKQVEYTKDAEKYITYQVQPNYKRLGPRVGKLMPGVKAAVAAANAGQMLAELTATGKTTLFVSGTPQSAFPTEGGESVELDSEDIQVRLQAKPGWAAAQGKGCVVVLSTELTPELLREGLARDLVRLVQDRRKEIDCQYTDRIEVGLVTASAELKAAVLENDTYLRGETLALKIVHEAIAGTEGIELEIGDDKVTLFVRVAK